MEGGGLVSGGGDRGGGQALGGGGWVAGSWLEMEWDVYDSWDGRSGMLRSSTFWNDSRDDLGLWYFNARQVETCGRQGPRAYICIYQ